MKDFNYYIDKLKKPVLSIIGIILVIYFCQTESIAWVLEKIAIIGVVSGLLWWGGIFDILLGPEKKEKK